MATALVVGGRGFIGGYVIAALRRQGWRVKILARAQGRVFGEDEVEGDLVKLQSEADWHGMLADIDAVVNAAGILREDGRQTFDVVHVKAPLALAQACTKRGIRFVQISALGHPQDGEFIASKHRFDTALLALPLPAVVLRPSVVYALRGSYGGTSLLRALAAFPGRTLMPGKGRWTFQPVSAEDLAEVAAAACVRGAPGLYELGCEKPMTLHHYQAQWRQWLQIPGRGSWQVPLLLVKCQVWLGQLLGCGPVNRTIWNMLLRGHSPRPDAHQRVQASFGVHLRSLATVLAAEPSQMQDRWAAQLYFVSPWLKWSVVVLWLWSAVVGFWTPVDEIEALTSGSVLSEFSPVAMARGAAVLDLVLGMGLALLPRPRPVVLAMLVSVAAYLLVFGIGLPMAWMEPMGGVVKNLVLLPALAVLWVLLDRR